MRMQYKKVGDTFTFPEYNAMCYLLTHGSWKESFPLKLKEEVAGQYANYILDDRNHLLSETREGYVFVKNIASMKKKDRLVYLKIKHDNLHSHLEVTFNAVHVTHINQQILDSSLEGDMSFTIQKEDFKDFVGTDEEEVSIYNNSDIQPVQDDILISVATDIDDEHTISVSFDPVEFGLTKGDWIRNVASLKLYYTEPEINYVDGDLGEENEIICETFEDLQKVVNSSPEGSVTKIRLLGTTYNFTDQLRITNKSIMIHGGNLDTPNSEPFTVLDAQQQGRHFIVDPDASLTIDNCKLINGNVYGKNGRYVLHNRGGSIYVHGRYLLDFDHYVIHGGLVKCTNCWFINNTAMLGGAIYNTMGKLEAYNCIFDGNKAIEEDRSEETSTYYYHVNNWGGAIFTETSQGLYYNDSTDRLHISPSNYVYNNNTDKTTIQLYFYKKQNTLLLEKETITKNNLKLFNYTTKEWIPITALTTTTQTSNPELSNLYTLTIDGQLTNYQKLYFRFEGNSSHPSIISHLVIPKDGVLK